MIERLTLWKKSRNTSISVLCTSIMHWKRIYLRLHFSKLSQQILPVSHPETGTSEKPHANATTVFAPVLRCSKFQTVKDQGLDINCWMESWARRWKWELYYSSLSDFPKNPAQSSESDPCQAVKKSGEKIWWDFGGRWRPSPPTCSQPSSSPSWSSPSFAASTTESKNGAAAVVFHAW